VSSADFAFDQPLKGVPRSPGKTSANFARRSCSVRWTLSPSDRRLWRSSRAGWLSGTRCGIPFLVRVAGIVQVAKSSESSAHVIPATSGLGFLFGRLREAQAEFHEEGDNGRRGAFTALAASWMFITLFRTPFEEELYVPILRLQDALAMLDKNRVEPIVKPARRSGRAPSSNTYLCLKGYAATTVELLLQAGLTRDDARRAVATQLRQLGVRPERARVLLRLLLCETGAMTFQAMSAGLA
jgi:hypothetical protein